MTTHTDCHCPACQEAASQDLRPLPMLDVTRDMLDRIDKLPLEQVVAICNEFSRREREEYERSQGDR